MMNLSIFLLRWACVYAVVCFCVLGLQINDIEPFCQDEIALYRQCAERRVRLLGYL